MADYSENTYQLAAWLVYINGLEIPVTSAEIRYGVWALPTLNITLAPHPLLRRIGAQDRLQVAFFYLDSHWDPGNPEFRLMGEFEVVGYSYGNSASGRSLTLKCLSQIQIFSQLRFFYISALQDIVTASSPTVATDASVSPQVKLMYPASLFLEGLTSPESIQTEGTSAPAEASVDSYIKRPIDFVTNIFRAHMRPVSVSEADLRSVPEGSETLPQSATSVPAKNFFARWFKMTGFHKRWAALPGFEDGPGETGCFPLVKAVQDTNVLPALQNQLGQGIGDSGTAWQLLQKVLSYMYMEVLTVPAPQAALTTKKTGVLVGGSGGSGIAFRDKEKSIATYFVKPMCTFALPPTCNIVFPSMTTNFNTDETYITQPTRLYLGEQFISEVITPQGGSIRNFTQAQMVTGYPDAVRKRMQDLLSASPESSNKNFLLPYEELYRGPVSRQMNAPPWMYMLSQLEKSYATKATDTEQEIAQSVGEEAAAPLGALFDQYAKYEFYRARYAERNGALALNWNPYIVPGFPVVAFDRESDGFDIMGYANTVTHSLNAGTPPTMRTHVGLTFVRTMPEFLGLVGEEVLNAPDQFTELEASQSPFYPPEEDEEPPDIYPPEVIPEVRDFFQREDAAADVYHRMFYRGEENARDTVFRWDKMLEVSNQYGDTLDLETESWKLDPYVTLRPKDGYQNLFKNYDAAMRYVARPACTLREYIETWHGRTMDELLADGTVQGEDRSFYGVTADAGNRKGAIFWARIYKLVQGPGSYPPTSVTNMGPAPDYASAGASNIEFVDDSTGQPETRRDWDTILEEYRNIVRGEGGNISPLS